MTNERLTALREVLDRRAGIYRQLNGARDLAAYLATSRTDDEEILTEPILADLLESVLGFPADGYFPQRSKSGLKPDFTPIDLVAHRYVLDAKSSAIADLDHHERQIRAYVDQRRLDFGVLFNLREVRVYRRGREGHDPDFSFQLEPLWRVARGEAMAVGEVERFERFVEQFAFRRLSTGERIDRIRRALPWRQLEARGETAMIDVEYLVDRLRDLSRTLSEDAASQQEALDRRLRFNPQLEHEIVAELGTLANDLEPGTNPVDLPATVEGFRQQAELAARVWRQYLLRVSQLALTRILLYRSWEDSGFVDEKLYDGGFGVVYERLNHRLGDVLAEAFAAGRERYPWLYGASSTYDWYRPRDEALVEVLYALLPVPLGKLDADVLGGLYESYVDEIDRDRLGQFYTPRSVVRFMLDRVGAVGAEGLFRVEGDRRRPRRLLDFATGSGGFLVEAARRIVDEVGEGDGSDVDDGLEAIVLGLHGCEISPFPYYLTEVNLLLQVSRLLGRLRRLGQSPQAQFTLGVVHRDTLEARREGFTDLQDEPAGLVHDPRFGLAPLDADKAAAFERISEPASFDYVVGNPPYVAESNNRAIFERLRGLPGWRRTYRGKSDYLYYFLWLASEQVADGGRVAVITPAGWMNAGDADWLRARLASVLRLDELFLFGAHRLFAPELEDVRDPRRAQAPTVESLILIATKAPAPPGHHVRVAVLEDERALARALTGDPAARTAERGPLLATMASRAAGRAGRRDGVLVHSVRQDALKAAEPWPVKFNARDLATRVVKHLDERLAAGVAEPLGHRWSIFQGVQTGADAFSDRVQRRMDPQAVRALLESGRRTREPILELTPALAAAAPWSDHPELLAHSVEARAILYGALDEADDTYLVWIDRGDEVPADVVAALEPWKPVLATRAEFARNARRRWFETAWPRHKAQLRRPKVIALYRTDRGRFAVDEDGDWQPSIKTTMCTARDGDLSVTYLGGLLNSELLDLWYAVRGKTPWHVRRNYEPKPMARIPYRHVETLDRDAAEVAAIRAAVGPRERLAACDALLVAPRSAEVLAAALEVLVRAVADNRRALLAERAVAPRLRAVVKDTWSTEAPALDEAALIAELAAIDTVSVRIDPALHVELAGDGRLGRGLLADDALVYRHGRVTTARVTGPAERLALLQRVTAGLRGAVVADLPPVLLPKDLDAFTALAYQRAAEIDALLEDGRQLVERAERIVCRLFDVPAEIEDEVVAHAVARAAARHADVEE